MRHNKIVRVRGIFCCLVFVVSAGFCSSGLGSWPDFCHELFLNRFFGFGRGAWPNACPSRRGGRRPGRCLANVPGYSLAHRRLEKQTCHLTQAALDVQGRRGHPQHGGHRRRQGVRGLRRRPPVRARFQDRQKAVGVCDRRHRRVVAAGAQRPRLLRLVGRVCVRAHGCGRETALEV